MLMDIRLLKVETGLEEGQSSWDVFMDFPFLHFGCRINEIWSFNGCTDWPVACLMAIPST